MNISPELRLAVAVAVLCGAMPAGERPAFEVASIRRHTAASGPVQRPGPTPNGFRSIGLPLDLANWQRPEMRQTMLRAMLQVMLEDRFKVVTHYENKEAPVYDLVVAKGGPKFKQTDTVDSDGGMSGTSVRVVPGPEGIQYKGISIAILAQTILDKTGLTGNYDPALPDLKRPSMTPVPSGDDESIFIALPEAPGAGERSGGEVSDRPRGIPN